MFKCCDHFQRDVGISLGFALKKMHVPAVTLVKYAPNYLYDRNLLLVFFSNKCVE